MKSDFFKYQAQTGPTPLVIEVKSANGSYIEDTNDKQYLDFVAGVSANTLGHGHPVISQAIKDQVDSYTHVMVYGEFIQQPQLELCKILAANLPESLSTTYITNSGTEATEGAIKLSKRYTGRSEIIAAKFGYHGNTMGSMSVCGAEEQNSAYRPLVPGIKFLEFNNEAHLEMITTKTAGVIVETIQGGAGFVEPENDYLKKLKDRCAKVGALLILDEILDSAIDAQVIEKMMTIIKTKQLTDKIKVFIVSHRKEINSIEADSIFQVVKTNGYSNVEEIK